MKKFLRYFNPTNPPSVPCPMKKGLPWGPSDNWEKLFIVEEDCGVFLFVRYTNGWQADTWHESVEEAKDMAKFGFGVDENAWEKCFDDEMN